MVSLQQKAEILLKYFREDKSQRVISRDLGISKKLLNVFKVINSEKQTIIHKYHKQTKVYKIF